MKLRKALMATGTAIAASGFIAGSAAAAFPDYSDCPLRGTGTGSCINIQARSGTMRIKDTVVPLGESLEIRGGLVDGAFHPATGTNGVIGRPVDVPGGLLGIDLPFPFTMVTATSQLAGPSSAVRISMATLTVSLPLKLKLSNPLLGSNCYIGSNSNPVNLALSPTRRGTLRIGSPGVIFEGQENTDSTFSVPGASGCLFGLGLVNALVDLKLGLPSSSGNNSLSVVNDIGIAPAL